MKFLNLLPKTFLLFAKPGHSASYITVQTPTGTVCAGGTATSTVSPSQLAAAVSGCSNIKPLGTAYTRNDVLDGICKPYTLIFARGTSEDGNLGNIVGPPFIAALENVLGQDNLAVQGVNDYPATGPEYCAGGSLTGSRNLAEVSVPFPPSSPFKFPALKDSIQADLLTCQLIMLTATQCPSTQLTVSGYSQGSQVVHNAFALLAANNLTSHNPLNVVTSAVLFGDPDRNLPLQGVPASDVSIDCHEGDDICDNGENVLLPHVTYCQDVEAQVEFVRSGSLEKK